MVFNSENCRVAFEPGDMIRCKNTEDAVKLSNIFESRDINYVEVHDNGHGQRGIWLVVVVEDEEAAEQ